MTVTFTNAYSSRYQNGAFAS